MTENDDRYGKNRNLWRKVYGYHRTKPRTVTIVDSGSQGQVTFDLNETYRHRDFFKIDDTVIDLPFSTQYDEGLITFTGETQLEGTFNFRFDRPPIVVLTMESSSLTGSENINVYSQNVPDFTTFSVGVSAPFSGTIRYRAVSSQTYPTQISGNIYTTTGSFHIYAGRIDAIQATEYTASYTITSGSLEYRATPHDAFRDGTADVDLSNVVIGVSQSTNTISAPLTNKIHFHVTNPS
jgi:hypothetical protein